MAWLKMAAAGLLAASTTVSAQEAPAIEEAGEIIDLNRIENYRFTVPVSIGGEGPYNFLIDTGAQATVLSRELADLLGVENRRPATLVGMNSSEQVEVAPISDFALGARMFDIMSAPLVAQANIGSADGVLGVDSLQEQRVLFDFDNRTIEVADASTLGGNRGFEIIVRARRQFGQLIITEASLNGIDVSLILGTGSEGSIGNRELERRLRARIAGDAEVTDINGAEENTQLRMARNLRIGRAKVSQMPIGFVDSPTFELLGLEDEPAILLGMNELRLFRRVAIDFEDRRELFDLPSRESRTSRRRDDS